MMCDSSTNSTKHYNINMKFGVQRVMKRSLSVLLLLLAATMLYGRGERIDVVSASGDSLRLNRIVELTSDGVMQRDLMGDTLEARKLFEEALLIDSMSIATNYQMSILLHDNNDKRALFYAKRALDRDTTNKWSQEQYAQTLLMNGRYDDAKAIYRKMIKRDPNNADYYRILAVLYQYTSLPYSAIEVLDSAELRIGRNPYLSRIKQNLLLSTRQEQRALDEALDIVANTPLDVQARLSLANIYVVMERDSLAEVEYNEALKIDGSSREVLSALGGFYEKRNRIDEYFGVLKRLFEGDEYLLQEALASIGRLTNDKMFYRANYVRITELISVLTVKYPEDTRVVDARANHLIAFGLLDEALDLYKSHTRDSIPNVEYFQSVIELESYKKRSDSVDLYLNRAIELFPDNNDLYIMRANMKAYAKDFNGAIESYHYALELVKNDTIASNIWGYIGDIEYQISTEQTKPSLAKKAMKRCYGAYKKALALNSDNITVLNNYAYFISEEESGNLDHALEMSTRAIALDDKNPTHLDTHAWILFKLGRLEEASQYMRTAISLDTSKSPELPLHYGDILAAQGNAFMAEVYWKRAEALGYSAEEIQKRIDKLKAEETK